MRLPEDGIFYYRKGVDFCVWVLEKDGLGVAPFDKHGDGDASLRVAVLTEDQWRAWLVAVALHEQRVVQLLRQVQRFADSESERARTEIAEKAPMGRVAALVATGRFFWQQVRAAGDAVGPAPPNVVPPELWQGNPKVQTLLHDLWKTYNRRGPGARRWRGLRSPALEGFWGSAECSAWEHELEARYESPESVPCVLLAHYPGPTIERVDSVLVLGAQQWAAPPTQVRDALEEAFLAIPLHDGNKVGS